jgi:predicted LPLAT superfamily acyltransferase
MSAKAWLVEPERGSRMGMELLVLASKLGRRPVHVLLWIGCWYFLLFAGGARRASMAYWQRVTGRSSWRISFRHFFRFAQVAFDRVYLLSGQLGFFEVGRTGSEHLVELVRRGRGALLLGAHFGSFEAMRAVAHKVDIKINILAHSGNAQRIAAMLDRVADREMALRVIEIRNDDPDYILEVKRRVDAGEFVALLGDRVGLNERSTLVPFLGGEARFPTGPYFLAHVLRCPVLFVYGTFEAPNRYHLHCEPFADEIQLTRGRRDEEAAEFCTRYAERLDALCRARPDNWFNFFDPWEEPEASTLPESEVLSRPALESNAEASP